MVRLYIVESMSITRRCTYQALACASHVVVCTLLYIKFDRKLKRDKSCKPNSLEILELLEYHISKWCKLHSPWQQGANFQRDTYNTLLNIETGSPGSVKLCQYICYPLLTKAFDITGMSFCGKDPPVTFMDQYCLQIIEKAISGITRYTSRDGISSLEHVQDGPFSSHGMWWA